MSAEQHRITLTESDDGHWIAREEPDGLTARGETKEAALAALDVADREGDDQNGVNPDDPFWSLLGTFEGGPMDAARNHDEYLYGEKRPE